MKHVVYLLHRKYELLYMMEDGYIDRPANKDKFRDPFTYRMQESFWV